MSEMKKIIVYGNVIENNCTGYTTRIYDKTFGYALRTGFDKDRNDLCLNGITILEQLNKADSFETLEFEGEKLLVIETATHRIVVVLKEVN